MVKKIIIFFLLNILFTFISVSNIYAQYYKVNYFVEYFLNYSNSKNLDSFVKYKINIKNLNDKKYVNKFSLIFPDTFSIANIQATDDKGSIEASIDKNNNKINIELTFSDPNKEQYSENNFYLSFNQSNLFNVNGNVWEVIIPIIESNNEESYEVTVNLPQNTNKKISIAKPIPNSINKNQIYWKNPKTKTIYAVFGDYQIYNVDLKYELINPRYTRVYTDVAFPPETQKIFIKNIDPLPNLVYLDNDGNYIGRYILNPKENKIIKYTSVIKIFTNNRTELLSLSKNKLFSQQKYLLNETALWKISDIQKYKDLYDAKNINNFIVNNFSYDYSRINTNTKRLGANYALNNIDKVLCTDFSDAFIALSREKGIYSREIQGFGFSQIKELRPLSLTGDILHSWSQYYDLNKNKWISIDPTWENTSGIDYFSSFDLNHIAFVIHGYKSDYPLAGGMYKSKDGKDINIKTTDIEPKEILDINLTQSNIPKNALKNKKTESYVFIKNKGNTFLYDVPILISSPDFIIKSSADKIDVIAPFEEKKINFSFITTKNILREGRIIIKILNNPNIVYKVKIINIQFYLTLSVIFIILLLIIIYLSKKNKINYENK